MAQAAAARDVLRGGGGRCVRPRQFLLLGGGIDQRSIRWGADRWSREARAAAEGGRRLWRGEWREAVEEVKIKLREEEYKRHGFEIRVERGGSYWEANAQLSEDEEERFGSVLPSQLPCCPPPSAPLERAARVRARRREQLARALVGRPKGERVRRRDAHGAAEPVAERRGDDCLERGRGGGAGREERMRG